MRAELETKRIMNKTIYFLLFLLCSTVSRAQVTARVEFPYREYKDTYTTPMGEYGVLEQMFDKKTQDDKRWFKIQHYNTNLKLVATDSMLISKDMELYTCESDREICYSILRESDDSFLIVAYNTNTHKTNVVEGEYTHKGSMRSLCIENGYLVFSSTQKKIERIGIVNLKNGDTKYTDIHIDDVRDKNIFILENTIIDGEVNSLVKVEDDVYLMRFGLDGSIHNRILLTKDMKEYLRSASISKSSGKYFLTGTYTKEKGGMAQGIYFAQLEGDKFKFIKFHNFLSLKNFTEYMSSKKKAKVERRKEKAEKNGKEYSRLLLLSGRGLLPYLLNHSRRLWRSFTLLQRIFLHSRRSCKVRQSGQHRVGQLLQDGASRKAFLRKDIRFGKSEGQQREHRVYRWQETYFEVVPQL